MMLNKKDMDPKIYTDPFLHLMSDMFNEKKGQIQKSIDTKGNFRMGFMVIIPATAPKSLTSDTTFSNYL